MKNLLKRLWPFVTKREHFALQTHCDSVKRKLKYVQENAESARSRGFIQGSFAMAHKMHFGESDGVKETIEGLERERSELREKLVALEKELVQLRIDIEALETANEQS